MCGKSVRPVVSRVARFQLWAAPPSAASCISFSHRCRQFGVSGVVGGFRLCGFCSGQQVGSSHPLSSLTPATAVTKDVASGTRGTGGWPASATMNKKQRVDDGAPNNAEAAAKAAELVRRATELPAAHTLPLHATCITAKTEMDCITVPCPDNVETLLAVLFGRNWTSTSSLAPFLTSSVRPRAPVALH